MSAKLIYASTKAACKVLNSKSAAVGFDARTSSPEYAKAVVKGLVESGCNVINLGLCGTEEIYFTCGSQSLDLGIMVTASHNPIDHNGLKLVGPGARPLTVDEFQEIRHFVASGAPAQSNVTGQLFFSKQNPRNTYARAIAQIALGHHHTPATAHDALRVVFNCGNGAAGPTLKRVISKVQERGINFDAIIVQGNPDPTFPNGIPNPLLPENHSATGYEVIRNGADFGVAFDGDFDRCFFFDASGQFVGGEYVVALLASATLKQEPGASIVHDPRVVYAVREAIEAGGGVPVQSKTGHAFVKGVMRKCGAAYGGELSAHHYFRDFYYCDSGMIPWVMVLDLLRLSGSNLSALVGQVSASFASSGEINLEVDNKSAAFDAARSAHTSYAAKVDEADGLSCDMGAWRFNLRASNTENLIRLNVEARGDAVSVGDCVAKLSKIIRDSQE